MDANPKDHLGRAAKVSYTIATVDFIIATVCAIHGDAHFIEFMILSGLMWAYGTWTKTKADETGG